MKQLYIFIIIHILFVCFGCQLQKDNNEIDVSINSDDTDGITWDDLLDSEDDIEALETSEGWVLRINVPRADLTVRPIYINGNRDAVYKRQNEGDYLCQDKDIRRMYAESNILEISQDSRILEGFSIEYDIDTQSFREYRQIFTDRTASHPWASLPDLSFLRD